MKTQWEKFIDIIRSEVVPALGCTEPVSAAYAAAIVTQMLERVPDQIDIRVSENLYKNAIGVMVPGTGEKGLHIAAAAGAVGGDAELGLEVLKGLTPKDVDFARQLISQNRITIKAVAADEFIYCEAKAKADEDTARVVISGGHTRIVEKRLNGQLLSLNDNSHKCNTKPENLLETANLSISNIYDFATGVELDEIRFINEAATINTDLSDEGLKESYGLEVGRNIKENVQKGFYAEDLANWVVMRTAAASDARMGGAALPAMSNHGSGNQGIVATIPVVEVAQFAGASEEQQTRALIMSHLMAIYIKHHYPPLCAFCGAAVTGASAAFAMTYLLGGSFEQCTHAMQNAISDCTGMICDGAKATCAMKVATASGTAVRSSLMALNEHIVSDQGIVADDLEQTIKNVGAMICNGMAATDKSIINIMAHNNTVSDAP